MSEYSVVFHFIVMTVGS